MKRIIIIFLMMCGMCFGATPIYVKTDGNDGNSGATFALAKLTVQAAYNVVDAGGEVRIQHGTYDLGDGEFDYLFLDDNKAVDFVGWLEGGTAVRESVIVQGSIGSGSTSYAVQFGSEAKVTFSDLTIKTATTVNIACIFWRDTGTFTPDLSLTNCVLINQSSAGTHVIRGLGTESPSARTLTITDCTLTAGDHINIEFTAMTNAYLTDSVFTSLRNNRLQPSVLYSESLGNVIAQNCTFTSLGAETEATIKILRNATLNLKIA